MILRHRHTNKIVHKTLTGILYVCAYTHKHKRGLAGAYTYAHTIQKSHITHEILMVQSNQQKWRWGRQREEERGDGKEESWKERQLKVICLHYSSGMWNINKMTA